ncbi:Uma2 family endonuclease [Candidatus Albibeggiatoa sp. nov. BB20]|uniref:Uma2 family endonuclease n=1 Tax=Candidatus Albibeggiatoa sp. nov. BB20 TaxID=3162723 RepID=UPI00336575DF
MPAQPQLDTPTTPEEYLAFERQSTEKHEFVDGIIYAYGDSHADDETYAMSGASQKHNIIAGNLFGELWTSFKKRDCSVYMSDMRVKVSETDYVYPDVVAVCADVELDDNKFDILLNPSVIIEVLSKSTKTYDKDKKMALYQNLPTVQDYVLVAQDQYRIEHYQRRSQNQWLLTVLTEPEQILILQSVDTQISVQDVYDKVSF